MCRRLYLRTTVTFSVAEIFDGFPCYFAYRGTHNSSGQSCFAVSHVYCFIVIKKNYVIVRGFHFP